MKSQIKRFSKSTMSVILAFCMLISCLTVGMIATDAAYDRSEAVGDTTYYMHIGVQSAFRTSDGIAFTYDSTNSLYYASYELTANSEYPMVICTTSGSLGDGQKSSSNQSVTTKADAWNPDSIQFDYFSYSSNNYDGYDCFKFKTQTTQTVYFTFTAAGSGLVVRSSLPSGGGSGGGGGGSSDPVQRYIYVGISSHYNTYKNNSQYGFNFWGGTSGGVKSGTYLNTYDWDGRTYYMYRVQVYDDNNKAQFKGNDSWYDPSGGFDVTLNGTTNNAVFFSHSDDGWGGQFQQNYQETSTASLSATSTSITTAQTSTLTPSLSTNATYNEIQSTTYSVSTNPGSAGSVTSAGVFSATAAGTYTVTATVTYNAKGFTDITKTATATKNITVTAASNPTCSAVSLSRSPSSGTIYKDATSVTYTASATSPVSGVYYNFKVDGTSVQNTTSNTYTTTFDSTGTKSVTVSVEKSSYDTVTSSADSITVENLPTVYFNWNGDGSNHSPTMTYDATASASKSNHIVYKLDQTWPGNSSRYIKIYDGSDRFKTSGAANITDNKPLSESGVSTSTTDNGWIVVNTNSGMTSSENGKYTFYWDFTDKKLYVEYPHKVTFNTDGGSSVASQIVDYNGKATRPSSDPEKTGYTFVNWVTESGGSTAFNFTGTSITTNKTIYASWDQDTYDITYPSTTTGYTLAGTQPSSAHYGDIVSFTVTASSGYRITGVTYTPTGGSAQNCTAGSNNTYSFTMPAANVTISVSTVQTYTVTLTAGEGFDSRQYKLGSSGTYQSYTSGTTLTVDAGTDVYFKVTYSTGYQYSSKTNLTVVTANTVFRTGAVSANVTATLTAEKIQYNLTGSVSPAHGTVTFYSNSGCTTQITTATYQQTVYAKYTPVDGYVLKNFTYSDTGITNTSTSGNVFTFTMGYDAAEITANVMLQYSVTYYIDMHDNNVSSLNITLCSNMGGTVLKKANGANCTADLTRVNASSKVYSATIDTPVTQNGSSYNDLYVKVTFNGTSYPLCNLPGSKVSTLVTSREMWLEAENEASTALTLNYQTRSVSDIPTGSMTGYTQSTEYSFTVSETAYTAYTNSQGTDYKVKLPLKRGSNTITLADNNEYSYSAEFDGDYVLTFTYSNNTVTVSDVSPIVRRIYLAKPYGWQTSESAWENIGIYHWGDYTDIGWNNGIKMEYLGYSGTGAGGYHYYYADIPKTINGNKVSNLIFQGWGSNQEAGTYSKAQTGNIENIPDSANFYILSKDGNAFVGTKSEEDAVIANYTRYVSSVAMNKTETTAVNIKPTFTGESISFTSNGTGVVTVDSNGNITPVGRGTTTITVKIMGTIGSLLTTEDNDHKDYITYPVSVTVKDPTQFNGFEIMSLESKTYEVKIPNLDSNGEPVDTGGTLPGYFDMSNVVMTVEGIHGVTSSTSSAIITQTSTASVDGIGTVCTAFTVQYAKANSLFENYGNISIIGKVTTKSIRRDAGDRYGHDHWTEDGTTKSYTTSRVIDNGVETATTEGIPFDNTKTTYSDIFAAYQYVDVTFTFNYDEYKPKKVDADGNVVADDDGMIQYPYDASWANNEDSSNAQLYGRSHTTKTFVVQNYEVRYSPEKGETFAGNLKNAATIALGIGPSNNYYDYELPDTVSATTPSNYKATSTVNLIQSVKQYKVYLNGELKPRSNSNDPNDNRTYYYYQEYAEPSVENPADWYAVDDRNSTDTTNAPLLATGVNSYKFRVKGSAKSTNTYLRTAAATNPHGDDFLRSEVDFSHYEVTHQGSNSENMKEYLMQNFYIADFFSPAKVLDPNSNNGQGNLPYDDAQFVGGGVVYYSMNGATENNQGTPFANAVSSGYVNGDSSSADYGKINDTAIKEMLKSNIEAQYAKDNIAGTVGEEDAMKAAYGTEIAATKNVEGGFNTGIIYRYLPLNQYTRYGSDEKTVDITVNNGSNITNYTLTTQDQTTQKWCCNKSQTSNADPEIANGKRTIRFTNIQNWDAVFVYFWGGSSASNWPGIRMTDKDNNVFEAVIPADATQIVFNDGCSMPATDENGSYTLDYSVNKNTFRYSNSLQSYQYVYASGNENKATNAGKNMRLYSYYVYSYVTYDQETNVPVTKYEIVLSDNYSDASTYWEGNPNPDPSN